MMKKGTPIHFNTRAISRREPYFRTIVAARVTAILLSTAAVSLLVISIQSTTLNDVNIPETAYADIGVLAFTILWSALCLILAFLRHRPLHLPYAPALDLLLSIALITLGALLLDSTSTSMQNPASQHQSGCCTPAQLLPSHNPHLSLQFTCKSACLAQWQQDLQQKGTLLIAGGAISILLSLLTLALTILNHHTHTSHLLHARAQSLAEKTIAEMLAPDPIAKPTYPPMQSRISTPDIDIPSPCHPRFSPSYTSEPSSPQLPAEIFRGARPATSAFWSMGGNEDLGMGYSALPVRGPLSLTGWEGVSVRASSVYE